MTAEDVTLAFLLASVVTEEDIEATFGQLLGLAEGGVVRKLVLNFRRVGFVNSAVLGWLVRLHTTLQAAGGRLILCWVSPGIFEVFKLTKLDKVFNVEEDTGAALRAFGVRPDSLVGEPEE
jgi:anti-sigma B factor antagonist